MTPHLNGSRGEFLLWFGVIYLAIGLNYALGGAPSSIVEAMRWMPAWSSVQTCGIAWALAGLVACVFAFTKMPLDRFGFMALAGWSAAWSAAYLFAGVFGYGRGFVGSLVFVILTRAVMLAAKSMADPIPVVVVVEQPGGNQ